MVKTKIIGEIGINYAYGSDKSKFIQNALKLIDVASVAGCDYVKFQKRTPNVCVPKEQKSKPKRVPWNKNEITYIEYKDDIEFGKEEFDIINEYCIDKGIKWFVSVWDKDSIDFMKQYYDATPLIMKIPSALITDIDLCKYARENCDFLIISTGMSSEDEVLKCINECSPDVIMHTNSTYPSQVDELNLGYIKWLKEKHPNKEVGYSGHEFGLTTTIATIPMGVSWIERHITLERSLWGSDQMASVEPQGLIKLVKSIKDVEKAMGGYGPRQVLGGELEKQKSLRK
jgi:N-acetylneuraminate synthase